MPETNLDHVANIGRNAPWLLMGMALILAIVSGFSALGYAKARDAQERINRVELAAATDKAAQKQGQKIAQVVTCFNAAKGRPLLTTVLRALASREFDPAVRAAFDQLITTYETSPVPGVKGQPTDVKCHALANRLGIDPAPYDAGGS